MPPYVRLHDLTDWNWQYEKIMTAFFSLLFRFFRIFFCSITYKCHTNNVDFQYEWDNYVPQWWVEFSDELIWLFTERFRAFSLICRKWPNPSQNFCYPHSLNFHLSGSTLFVSKQQTQLINQLNSILAAHNCHIWVLFFWFVQLYKAIFSFSDWDKSRNPRANSQKIEDM